jgi:hypothetical protein
VSDENEKVWCRNEGRDCFDRKGGERKSWLWTKLVSSDGGEEGAAKTILGFLSVR